MAHNSKRRFDPELESHKAWMGLVQPVGLVVAPPALVKAQVFPDKAIAEVQQAFQAVLERPAAVYTDPDPVLADFPRFATEVMGWQPGDLAGGPGGPALPERLAVHLPDYGETLRPTYAVVDAMADGKVLLLVAVVEPGADLDKPPREAGNHGWQASPQARLERLLRDAEVPAGLLGNGEELRLVYAPRGESSGHIGFPVAEMATVGGRPILAALHMLLSEHRLMGAADGQRLLDLMAESRKYQSEVSTRLSEQVLGALWELLRGFQAADEAANGRVLFELARTEPDTIYGGLLTVIMRLVFLLYAEDQGLMPDSEVYARNYSIGGLYERLREDAGRYPDTMDQRFGAWAWLLTTFRMVFDGGGHGGLRLPTRHGQLFNPDEYPFLEGRPPAVRRVVGQIFEAPRVSDGVVWRVLEGLLVLGGERLSYRALDVEQVGSVYESMMGFDVRTTAGRAIAVRPKHIVIDLDKLLAQPAGERAKWLKDEAETDLPSSGEKALKDAESIDDLVAALDRRVSPQTTRPLPPRALFLQPGEERRRSGSHYTPRELTEPIVRTTLRPVLEGLGERPTPDQILDLKVCDPAMGSGAFLVEACRQLAVALVTAWEVHDCLPALPPDEDPLLHARRLVAQRCLYGVDKNRFAVNLAKLSLWLVTLAKDHAFTFLDHALKHGDSLVGLTREQIGAFHWDPPKRDWGPLFTGVTASVDEASAWRREIQSLGEGDYDQRRAAWREAEDVLHDARLIGDLCIAAFFGAENDKERKALRVEYRRLVDEWKAGRRDAAELVRIVEELRGGERPVPTLHWEIEFPEVFGGERPGFHVFVGNPPFQGSVSLSRSTVSQYTTWLRLRASASGGKADLVAFFFRGAFNHLAAGGALGLIATNTIRQGDTRESALVPILESGGQIYAATRRRQWPGAAAVTVSVVHISRSGPLESAVLDGKRVNRISAYLLPFGPDRSPMKLSNGVSCLLGTKPGSAAFVVSDSGKAGFSSIEMAELTEEEPAAKALLFDYLSGDDLLSHAEPAAQRRIVDFGEIPQAEARSRAPRLLTRIGEMLGAAGPGHWHWHARRAKELRAHMTGNHWGAFLCTPETSKWHAVVRQSGRVVPSNSVVCFTSDHFSMFAILQSLVHEGWCREFSSTLEDRLRYVGSDCFDTFPLPPGWQEGTTIEAVGRGYYEFRAALMIRNEEGLTATYNRFHDPDDRSPDILRLRELHAEMDRAVLDAYGWTDILADCDFFLDYEIDEETWGNKKKPWRYRWPDEVHDEVLARLLDLNQKRYEEEVAAGLHDKGGKKTPAKTSSTPKPKPAARKTRPAATPPGTTLSLFNSSKVGDDE